MASPPALDGVRVFDLTRIQAVGRGGGGEPLPPFVVIAERFVFA